MGQMQVWHLIMKKLAKLVSKGGSFSEETKYRILKLLLKREVHELPPRDLLLE